MNVTLLLMSSALVAGGDPGCADCSPAPATSYSAPCGCDPCGSGGGMFSKLKSRFGGKPLLFGCGGFKKDDCDPCAGPRPGLFSRLKDKLGCHKDEPCPCAAPCDPCGGGGAVSGCALPAVPSAPSGTSYYADPQAMPQPVTGQPQAMPSTAAPEVPAPAKMPEPMPKPAEVPEPPKANIRYPVPATGIPSLDLPRI